MRLIDADALKEELAKRTPHFAQRIEFTPCFEAIRDAPTVDAVQIVRCGECKFYSRCTDHQGICMNRYMAGFIVPDWYCADGEREEVKGDAVHEEENERV